jgi:hypothetical protein
MLSEVNAQERELVTDNRGLVVSNPLGSTGDKPYKM